MFVTTHSLVAMTIAVKTGNPFIYVPVAAVDHLVLDQLPHFGLKKFTMKKFQILSFFDAIFTFIFLALVVAITNFSIPILFLMVILAGWPDIFWFIQGKKHGFLEGKFKYYHKKIQNYESHWGLLVEVIVVVSCFWWLTH